MFHGTVDHDGTLPPAHSIRITHWRLCKPLYQRPVQCDTADTRYGSSGWSRIMFESNESAMSHDGCIAA
jgi:hypothetical protein